MAIFTVLLIFVIPYTFGQGTMDDHMALKETLFRNYSKEFRPVYNFTHALHVNIQMFLISLLDLDEITGTVSLNGGLLMRWIDYRLVWNPVDFGGIKSVVFNSSNLWKPRVYLITSSDDLSDFSFDAFDVRVFSNGMVLAAPGRNIKTSCSIDMTKFPVDSHTCTAEIVSWMYSINEMKFIIEQSVIDLSLYRTHGEWDIDWTSVTNSTNFQTGTGVVNFSIHLSRRYLYFVISMAIPVLLLCFLDPFVFLLPAASGERISYTITIFLSLAVYMTLVGDNMPKVSDPMAGISYFLLVTMLYCCLLILLTIVTLRCHNVSDIRQFPCWLIWLVYRVPLRTLVYINDKGSTCNIHNVLDAGTGNDEEPKGEERKCIARKEDLTSFIDKCLFCITLLIISLTCLVFMLYYWYCCN